MERIRRAHSQLVSLSRSARLPRSSQLHATRESVLLSLGAHVDGFVEAIAHVARQFDPGFDASTIEQRPSKGGNYLGLTITITATSREQLDEIYRTLTTHPMVKVVL